MCVIKSNTPIETVSVSVYGALMIWLYLISCLYHALSPKLIGKKVLRIIDHSNVLLMVAGTYVPICLSLLGGKLGWIVFAIVWTITIISLILNLIDVDKYQGVLAVGNVILGWGALLIFKPLLAVCPMSGLYYLIIGGVMYSLGAILYGLGYKMPYMHSVFHLFVLAGSAFHFFFIYLYCI